MRNFDPRWVWKWALKQRTPAAGTIAPHPFAGKYPTRIVLAWKVPRGVPERLAHLYVGRPSKGALQEAIRKLQELADEYRTHYVYNITVAEFDTRNFVSMYAESANAPRYVLHEAGLVPGRANPGLRRYYHPWQASQGGLNGFVLPLWVKTLKFGEKLVRVYSPYETLKRAEQILPHKAWVREVGWQK